ncbi:MAG: amino acid permease [Rhodanobacteraceae bacterium]|nr:amino acid permease [Rhodanobacteraceae bacterium]
MPQQSPSETAPSGFRRSLSLLDGTMLVAGSMIGSGIFIVSADIVRMTGSAAGLVLVWLISGFMTIAGALSYAEFAAMFPKAGGQYVYLREAWGRLPAFLYGWSFFAVIQTGSIAAVGVAFAKFAAYLMPALGDDRVLLQLGGFRINAAQCVSIVVVLVLTFVNVCGVNYGKWIQTVFTIAKIAAVLALIVLGMLLGANASVWQANWGGLWERAAATPQGLSLALLPAIAVAMVGALFSSDSWHSAASVADEIRNPRRNVGLSLFLGAALVCSLYLVANLMYLAVLPLDGIALAASDRVGVAAAQVAFGSAGTVVMALLIMVSTFGCVNGLVLAGARVYYSMARDGLFFARAAELNRKAVPGWALWAQAVWACLLCLSGRYGDLLDYVILATLIFYVLAIAGLFRLRRTRPDLDRPYRAFGYPWLPALYILLATAIGLSLLVWKPAYTWPGLLIVLLGVPVFYTLRGREPQRGGVAAERE